MVLFAVGGIPSADRSWPGVPTASAATAGSTDADPGAPPAWGCPAEGILFQYPDGQNTIVYTIDMVSGDFTSPFTLEGFQINAIAHNPLDSFIYGWDLTSDRLVRIASDGTVTLLSVAGVSSGARLTGDIDPNGHYWLTGGGGSGSWKQIDIATLTVLNTGPIEGGGVSNFRGGADWAYVPGGGDALYRVMRNVSGSEAFLFRFDLITHQHANLGSLGDLGAPNSIGAVYSAPDGFLYASNNANGVIYRIDLDAVTATEFAPGPESGTNDGARCFSAKIPVDFGDAPDTYGTLLASNGARHGIINYDRDASTSSLMIGSLVDAETDGFPGPEADGDNLNNTNDEEGLAQPIVMVAGQSTDVTVTVTNATDNPATLAGWIDLDGSGTFDVGERQVTTVAANTTADHTLTFAAGTTTDSTYARFRLYPGEVAEPSPVGPVAGGEVEDHQVLTSASAVTKTSDPASGTSVAAGDTVTYTLAVTNTGTVDLTSTVTDDLSGVLDDATLASGPTVDPAGVGTAELTGETLTWSGTLEPGATATITYAVTVAPAAERGDAVLTNAVVGGQCPTPAVTDPDAAGFNADCVTTHLVAEFTVAKSSDVTSVAAVGESISYAVVVTNTGGAALSDVSASDPMCGLVTVDSGDLAPGGQRTFTCEYTVTQADLDAGSIVNVATVTASDPGGEPLEPVTGGDTVEVVSSPALAVTKVADVPVVTLACEVITYTVGVTNTGNRTLVDLQVTDPLCELAPVDDTIGSQAPLAPAETREFTCTYAVTQADLDGGGVANTAMVEADTTGVAEGVGPVEASVFVPTLVDADFELTKSVDLSSVAVAGEVATYTVTMTNTGNVTLDAITVTDPLCTLSPSGTGPLAPSQSRGYTCGYTVTQADVDAGALVNRADATATPAGCGDGGGAVPTGVAPVAADADRCAPMQKQAAVTVPSVQAPGVSLIKTVTPEQVVVGGDMTFTIEVVNTGNVTLVGAKVTDPLCELQMMGTDPEGDGNLGAGERWEFQCTYQATAADAAAGKVTNIATVESQTLTGGSVSAQGSATAQVSPLPPPNPTPPNPIPPNPTPPNPLPPQPVPTPGKLPVTGATIAGVFTLGLALLLAGFVLMGRAASPNRRVGRSSI